MLNTASRRLIDSLLISGLAGLLILAFLFDIVRRKMLDNAQSTFDAQRLAFLQPLMALLLMVAVLGLIWVAISSPGYSRWVSVVYLVVGLFLLYALALLTVLPLPDPVYVLVLYLAPENYLYQLGAAVAAFGLISLFFWKEAKPQIFEAESG